MIDIKEIPITIAIKRILKNVVYEFIARIPSNISVSLPESNHNEKIMIMKTPNDVSLPRKSEDFEGLKRSILKTTIAKLAISNSGDSNLMLSVFTIC